MAAENRAVAGKVSRGASSNPGTGAQEAVAPHPNSKQVGSGPKG